MRRLIVSEAGLFLTEQGGWTNDPENALEFLTVLEALQRAHTIEMHNLKLYYAFPCELPKSMDFTVSLSAAAHQPDQTESGCRAPGH